MNKRVQIMLEPCSINERFEHTVKLMLKTHDKYHGTIFTLSTDFRLVMNVYFDEQYYQPKTGGSIIKMPEGIRYPEDAYVRRSGQEFTDFYMMNTLTRYFNWCLDEEERAAVITKFFSCLCDSNWKAVCMKYGISKRKYYEVLERGKEKLIEVWGLDGYGGPEDEYYSFLGRKYVWWKREQRTGIPGGYMGLHPEWLYMFIDKGATMTTPGECYWKMKNDVGAKRPRKGEWRNGGENV